MVLTTTELRRIEILSHKAKTGATIEECAETFGVSVSCVSGAIRWGKKHRLLNLAAIDDLAATVATLESRLSWLEKQRRAYERAARDQDRLLPTGFIGLYLKESREYEMLLAELRGFYNRTLNVNVSGAESFLDTLERAHSMAHGSN